MTINEACTAIEKLLEGRSILSSQVRPSGDDVDVIKIWVDLGTTKTDPDVWAKSLEDQIRKELPDAAAFRLQIRAESNV